MTDKNNIEDRLEELGQAIGSDESLVSNVMSGIDAEIVAKPDRVKRVLPMRRLTGLAAAVTTIAFVLLIGTLLDRSTPRAYGVEQTIEAIENVRFMHMIQRDRAGSIEDERWIEIGPDGRQARYRQVTPMHSFFVVDDRKAVFVHYADKNTAVLYDPNDRWWTWHYAPGKLFEQLAADGDDYYTVAENVRYKGRPAHHLRWAVGAVVDIYVDPKTRLPIAHGSYEIDYQAPPEGTFDIVIPDDVVLVDRRPGAESTQGPQWLVEEERKGELDDAANGHFNDARRALAGSDHTKAAELFSKVVEVQPGRNWAWFWLGRAHYELGEYDLAVREFSKVFDIFDRYDFDLFYCHLARGLAFKAMDKDDMAHRDLSIVLPVMIDSLRDVERTAMFEYADDPMFRSMSEDERPGPQQRQWNMIRRLRDVTGQNFGYDPDATEKAKKRAIDRWTRWWQEEGKDHKPDLGDATEISADTSEKERSRSKL